MKMGIFGVITLACLLFATPAEADTERQRKTFAGLQGVYVVVEAIDQEHVKGAVERELALEGDGPASRANPLPTRRTT